MKAWRPGFYSPLGLAAFAVVAFCGFLLDLVFAVSTWKVTTYVRGLSDAALTSVLAPQITGFAVLTTGLMLALGFLNNAKPRAAWAMLVGSIAGVIAFLPLIATLAMSLGAVSPKDFKAAVLVGTEAEGGR